MSDWRIAELEARRVATEVATEKRIVSEWRIGCGPGLAGSGTVATEKRIVSEWSSSARSSLWSQQRKGS